MPEVEVDGRTYSSKLEMLKHVGAEILRSYSNPITLRQLYYQFVGRDLIENKESQYQYLSKAMTEARLEGIVPFSDIEDRQRQSQAGDAESISRSDHLEQYINALKKCPQWYDRPQWEGQRTYVEAWVEKNALSRLFQRVGNKLGVTTFACQGYPSWTSLNEAKNRFVSAKRDPHVEQLRIVYFGDYDPSGQDIERFLTESLSDEFDLGFVHSDFFKVERKALHREQIDRYELPPQPAKKSDSRYEDFVKDHGTIAVELDALDPDVLENLIEDSVMEYYDEEQGEAVEEQQAKDREWLQGKIDQIDFPDFG